MNQMMLESKWIVGLYGDFVLRPAAAEIVVNVGGMMVDHYDHSSDLMCLRGFPQDAGFLEKATQPGYFLDFKIMGAGALKKSLLGTHYKRKLVVSVRLDLPNLSDEVNNCAPT
jgi:hypothetical protein